MVGRLASPAESLPEVGARERTRDSASAGLVKHGITSVYPLHHLGVAHRCVGVGRRYLLACNSRTIEKRSVPDPLEAQADGGADEGGGHRLGGGALLFAPPPPRIG